MRLAILIYLDVLKMEIIAQRARIAKGLTKFVFKFQY
jgi:hypothetical protein